MKHLLNTFPNILLDVCFDELQTISPHGLDLEVVQSKVEHLIVKGVAKAGGVSVSGCRMGDIPGSLHCVPAQLPLLLLMRYPASHSWQAHNEETKRQRERGLNGLFIFYQLVFDSLYSFFSSSFFLDDFHSSALT